MNACVAVLIPAVFILAEEYHNSNLQDSEKSKDIGGSSDYPGNCADSINVPEDFRFLLWNYHNSHRALLQLGEVRNGNEGEGKKFPSSSDMNLLAYDCDLERSAWNISKQCQNTREYDFSNVGTNSETFYLSSTASALNEHDINSEQNTEFYETMYEEIIPKWWNTSENSPPLADNLKPTDDNKPMIPFLQMANAKTTKVGCAYSICDSSNSASKFVSFVCIYGDELISKDKPLYTKGTPCDTCPNNCDVSWKLCKRTSN
ncbi:hypothetical protein KIN20_008041 [Parelaphostrongylus tenuis]|uniref:SCP domain-containing protein n=1 Tax=Parelaphostrongylus tenuis TaxID=148309 RepID=A0AAD5MN92_PARTN|nr:hypothetical protein KIN20_008041 [Parelaphostrongylus tenuis]